MNPPGRIFPVAWRLWVWGNVWFVVVVQTYLNLKRAHPATQFNLNLFCRLKISLVHHIGYVLEATGVVGSSRKMCTRNSVKKHHLCRFRVDSCSNFITLFLKGILLVAMNLK